MGMFDYIRFEVECPKCNEKVSGFQSKDGGCGMHTLEFWEVNNFYSSCFKCNAWIEYNIIQRPNRRLTIKDYNMIVKGGRRKKKEAQKK